MSPSKRKRRARRGSRGAVMAEAAVVLPVLVTLFYGTHYVYEAYKAKLTSVRSAHAEAWRQAVQAGAGGVAANAQGGGGGSSSALASIAGQITQAKTHAQAQSIQDALDTNIDTTSANGTGDAPAVGPFEARSYQGTESVFQTSERLEITPAEERQQVEAMWRRYIGR